MGSIILSHTCPECGGKLSQRRKKGGGHRCRTCGCDIQHLFYNKKGELVRIVRSSVPRRGLLPLIQRISDQLLFDKGVLVVPP